MSDELSEPESNLPVISDKVHLMGRMAIGSIPIAGGAALELFNVLIRPQSEARLDAWKILIVERLRLLEDESLTIEKLQADEQFNSIVMQATYAALNTHQEEKLEALANAVANTAGHIPIDESVQQVFIGLVESLTPWHLRILRFFHNPQAWFIANNKQPPSMSISGSRSQVLQAAYPEFLRDAEFARFIISDLKTKGLADIGLSSMVTGNAALSPAVTDLGKRFIDYISRPK